MDDKEQLKTLKLGVIGMVEVACYIQDAHLMEGGIALLCFATVTNTSLVSDMVSFIPSSSVGSFLHYCCNAPVLQP